MRARAAAHDSLASLQEAQEAWKTAEQAAAASAQPADSANSKDARTGLRASGTPQAHRHRPAGEARTAVWPPQSADSHASQHSLPQAGPPVVLRPRPPPQPSEAVGRLLCRFCTNWHPQDAFRPCDLCGDQCCTEGCLDVETGVLRCPKCRRGAASTVHDVQCTACDRRQSSNFEWGTRRKHWACEGCAHLGSVMCQPQCSGCSPRAPVSPPARTRLPDEQSQAEPVSLRAQGAAGRGSASAPPSSDSALPPVALGPVVDAPDSLPRTLTKALQP